MATRESPLERLHLLVPRLVFNQMIRQSGFQMPGEQIGQSSRLKASISQMAAQSQPSI